jgi:hypothetical protein
MFGVDHTAEEAIHGQRHLWRRVEVTSCPTTGYVVLEYWACGKVIDTKRYSPTEFAHQGKNIAWMMGQHVTP